METTITKTQVECYKIRNASGIYWADIVLDSGDDKGRISISSDFGTWSYFWGACGNFKKFLIKINKEYLADKFNEDRHFDLIGTIKEYKNQIIDYRRNEGLDGETARKMWDELDLMHGMGSKHEFIDGMYQSENLCKLFDTGPDYIECISPRFQKFWDQIWPCFINELNKELEFVF